MMPLAHRTAVVVAATALMAAFASPVAQAETPDTLVLKLTPTPVAHLRQELGSLSTTALEILGGDRGEFRGGYLAPEGSVAAALTTFEDTWNLSERKPLYIDALRVPAQAAAQVKNVLKGYVTAETAVPSTTPVTVIDDRVSAVRPQPVSAAVAAELDVPDRGMTLALNQQGHRGIRHSFFGLSNSNGAYGSGYSFYAYEHDTKVLSVNGGCNDNDFWILRNGGLGWSSNLPGAYFDTNASDPCNTQDMTVGSWNAHQLNGGTTYTVDTWGGHGGAVLSHMNLTAQALRIKRESPNCSGDTPKPWCVGVDFPTPIGRSVRLISLNPVMIPACYSWRAGGGGERC
ncbi:hypothetical protein [Nonomuraea sp. NPDC059022]|uniref:hypothetical protein n=1 Tax=Nonomuraea sp. NPDC059022 TaxID=3346705 RepID=UPI0036BCE366